MTQLSEQFYRNWRIRNLEALRFLDKSAVAAPPESLLQAIWRHQRLHGSQLKTLDGQPLHILHPGFLNREAGPDFKDAVIALGSNPPVQGDVEIDLATSNWRSHGHFSNQAYRQVILHAVWEASKQEHGLPVLELKSFLDASLEELSEWLDAGDASSEPPITAGKCQESLARLDADTLRSLLQQAALARLQAKAAALEARARQVGLDHALWEGLFGALGFKQNYWPMRQVAEKLKEMMSWQPASVLGWQARLLGTSGFLPSEPPAESDEANQYVRRLWHHWWRERKSDEILPAQIWQMSGIRPANHPQRRLALGAHWLCKTDLIGQLESWMLADIEDSRLSVSLLAVFQPVDDDFWSWHWSYPSQRVAKKIPLLGGARLSDMAINVVLPWFWMRAKSSGSVDIQKAARRRYEVWPKSEDNAEIRKTCRRLLGERSDFKIQLAAEQQGLLQLSRDFCKRSNSLCQDCRLVEMVQNILSNPFDAFTRFD